MSAINKQSLSDSHKSTCIVLARGAPDHALVNFKERIKLHCYYFNADKPDQDPHAVQVNPNVIMTEHNDIASYRAIAIVLYSDEDIHAFNIYVYKFNYSLSSI